MDFETLEHATEAQKEIANWLLLRCAESTVMAAKEDRDELLKKFEQLKKIPKPDFNSEGYAFKQAIKKWWLDEIKWHTANADKFSAKDLDNFLVYRMLRIFFKNHSSNPFQATEKEKTKTESFKDFYHINQNLFADFLKGSIDLIAEDNELVRIRSVADNLTALRKQKLNILDCIDSAAHRLFGKDLQLTKGFVVGGTAGVISSLFLGPVIGGVIGKAAGFSGAAATSYGLALLGGGAIASGGMGMAGGSLVLGLGFGITSGVVGIKNVAADELDHAQAMSILPLLLAIGKIQYHQLDDTETSGLIHNAVVDKLKKLNKTLNKLKDTNDKDKIKTVRESMSLYQNAVDMSELYDWLTLHDRWQRLKKWPA